MLSMLLYVIIIENSYNNNNNNVQNKVSLSKGSVAQCTKKKKKRRGDVAHMIGTKNKIKPLT